MNTKRKRSPETKLRSARAEIRALREELAARRRVGGQISSHCLPLSHLILIDVRDRNTLSYLCRAWDAIKSVPEGGF